ncbi:hypothetical protein CB1_001345001 [Camelus ferus]|nr:hypothetical protein CB1_001345001 [Camelus ferus]
MLGSETVLNLIADAIPVKEGNADCSYTPRLTSTDPLSQREHLRNSDRTSSSSKDKDAKNLGLPAERRPRAERAAARSAQWLESRSDQRQETAGGPPPFQQECCAGRGRDLLADRNWEQHRGERKQRASGNSRLSS